MHFAFCLLKYFPYGGLQRDFIKIARAAVARGHRVTVFTMAWQGPLEPGLQVQLIAPKGLSNHRRAWTFSQRVHERLANGEFDACLGFNRQTGLDLYFGADPCLAGVLQQRGYRWRRLWPRYRRYLALEAEVYGPSASTQVLLLDPKQQAVIQAHYHTPSERFRVIPPGIEPPSTLSRPEARAKAAIAEDAVVLLAVGYDQKRKGLDRSLLAVAALPAEQRHRVELWVVGQVGVPAFAQQAKALGIEARVRFLGSRDDVYDLMKAADLLLHPAYQETAGMVLVESLVNGLPVIVTANCGYAFHIAEAQAGCVILGGDAFQQHYYNQALSEALTTLASGQWQANALSYADRQDLFAMPGIVIDCLEHLVESKAAVC